MTDNKRGVPGIPLQALDSIQDQNVSTVLRAIVDGWHVRNGSAGTGDARFVTLSEINNLQSTIQQDTKNSISRAIANYPEPTLTPGQINRIINDLQASVMASQLWQELGSTIGKIDLSLATEIEKQLGINTIQGSAIKSLQTVTNNQATQISGILTRVGANESAILTEQQTRIDNDNAIATSTSLQFSSVNNSLSALQTQQTTTANTVSAHTSSITSLQASVGSNATAIQLEADARATADGQINSKYTVKIDSNGYVTGFGLISTANNSTPYSEFIVRADKFAVGSPSGPEITPTTPFLVTTTNTTMPDGTVYPPGVYIDYGVVKYLTGAFIDAGLLHAAKIYTGSQYVDFESKYDIPAVSSSSVKMAITGAQVASNKTVGPITDSSLMFYGPNWHWAGSYWQRVTSGDVAFSITVVGVVDHFLSLWYRVNGGNWINISTVVEPKDSYGAIAISCNKVINVPSSGYVDFGIFPTKPGFGSWSTWGSPLDTGKMDMTEVTFNVMAINL